MKHLGNKPSRLLTAEQNAAVFKMVGANCNTLTTAVASLYFYVNQNWTKQFSGILCFERDNKKKRYYLRFYRNCFSASPEMVLQQRVKPTGLNFAIVRDQLFQLKIGLRSIGIQFAESPESYEESSDMAKVLRGNMKLLKREAEARYYEEHPEKQKESRFKKLLRKLHLKKKVDKAEKISPKGISASVDARKQPEQPSTEAGKGAEVKDWTEDPVVGLTLEQMGVDMDDLLESYGCRQKMDILINRHGGLASFRRGVLDKGYATQSLRRESGPYQTVQNVEDPPRPKKNRQPVNDSPPRSDEGLDDSLSTPVLRELNESWFRVNDCLDFIYPDMPIFKPQPTKGKGATEPAGKMPPRTESLTPAGCVEEYEEGWLKVVDDGANIATPPPPPVKGAQPHLEKPHKAPKRAKPNELLGEITQFNPTKTRKVPVMYTSTPKKPGALTVIPQTSVDADISAAEALAIDLNKTVEEIQVLAMAEKRAKRDKRRPKSESTSTTDTTTSDSVSDSGSDEK